MGIFKGIVRGASNLILSGAEKVINIKRTRGGLSPVTLGRAGEGSKSDIFGTKAGKALNILGEGTILALGAVGGASAIKSAGGVAKVGASLLPKTALGAVKVVAGVGLVSGLGLKGVKDIGKRVFETSKAGGQIIAGKKEVPTTLEEGLKTAGLIGAGAVAGATVLKVVDKFKDKSIPTTIPQALTTNPFIPKSTVTPTSAPVVEPVAVEPKEVVGGMPDINIKVNNKPNINIAIAR